jgi:hypothetical protein
MDTLVFISAMKVQGQLRAQSRFVATHLQTRLKPGLQKESG